MHAPICMYIFSAKTFIYCSSYQFFIQADTLKVIYAFGDRDPDGYEVNFDNYHGENRGMV